MTASPDPYITAAAARCRRAHRAYLLRVVTSAVIAIQAGKLPQWRARPQPSRRVALALGFRELGSQVSIRLAAAVPSHER
jgi:hypothetical protein